MTCQERRLNPGVLGHLTEAKEIAVNACDHRIDSSLGEGVFSFSLVDKEVEGFFPICSLP